MWAIKVILVIAVLTCPSWAFRSGHLVNRIIGGTDADIKDSPYVVALMYHGQQWCGGSLIASNIVVTAAHCLQGLLVSKLNLIVGSSRWHSGGQQIPAKQFFIHKNFTGQKRDYDVGIVILCKDVQVKNAIPISLAPANRQYPPGTLGVAFGWGQTNAYEPFGSKILMKVEVPIVDERTCQKIYRGNKITHRHICTGYRQGTETTCYGDSGGPLVINGELAGIVSFGPRYCSINLMPAVYTSVSAFHDWITQHAGI